MNQMKNENLKNGKMENGNFFEKKMKKCTARDDTSSSFAVALRGGGTLTHIRNCEGYGYLVRVGRPEVLWTVNALARAVKKMELSMRQEVGKTSKVTFNALRIIDNFVMLETEPVTATLVCEPFEMFVSRRFQHCDVCARKMRNLQDSLRIRSIDRYSKAMNNKKGTKPSKTQTLL